MDAFEQAWQLLKVDLSDIAPFPSRYKEESYIPDLQEMLELEAIRQASGQEVPRFLLREPRMMRNVPSSMQNFPLMTRPLTIKDIYVRMDFAARAPNQFASVQSMNNEE